MEWLCRPCSSASVEPSGNSEADGESAKPALAAPVLGIDPDWRERIELAKRAYQDGKKLREGKPITFRANHPLPTPYPQHQHDRHCRDMG